MPDMDGIELALVVTGKNIRIAFHTARRKLGFAPNYRLPRVHR